MYILFKVIRFFTDCSKGLQNLWAYMKYNCLQSEAMFVLLLVVVVAVIQLLDRMEKTPLNRDTHIQPQESLWSTPFFLYILSPKQLSSKPEIYFFQPLKVKTGVNISFTSISINISIFLTYNFGKSFALE